MLPLPSRTFPPPRSLFLSLPPSLPCYCIPNDKCACMIWVWSGTRTRGRVSELMTHMQVGCFGLPTESRSFDSLGIVWRIVKFQVDSFSTPSRLPHWRGRQSSVRLKVTRCHIDNRYIARHHVVCRF